MQLAGTRFGDIELDDGKAIVFPRGLVGFPEARRYVLLDPQGSSKVAWLQSLDVPELAFPVIEGSTMSRAYPDPPADKLANEAGLGGSEVALLVVVAVRKGKGLVANLLAPLVVDLESRSGAQVVLDPKRYSATVALGPEEDRAKSLDA
ncbi:MAG: flagellar assembly protein FliW [Myxococcales bacterium]|nr:flagellar assembly protein FliW [Myxococcales bacterium]